MSVAMSYTDETQLGRNILEYNMGSSIFLTRLIRYSAQQFWLFKVSPNKEQSNKTERGKAWLEEQVESLNTYMKASAVSRGMKFSYLIDEVDGDLVIVHKMAAKEVTAAYRERWLLYVACCAALHQVGDKTLHPTRQSPSQQPVVLRDPSFFLHIGDEWFEVVVKNKGKMLDFMCRKATATKHKFSAIKFDSDESNASILNKYVEVSRVDSPRG